MANEVKMDVKHSIQALYMKGWSRRKIARELHLHRRTVTRYVDQIAVTPVVGSKCTISTAGNSTEPESFSDPKCTISTAGKIRTFAPSKPGRASSCEPFRAAIERGLEQGLTAQRIYQDLIDDSGFDGSYEAVKRFTRHERKVSPKRFERMETAPGVEMQVDFGTGAWIVDAEGRRKRSWILRVVLSHSRKGYCEAVFRQDSESFLRCMENAFRHFGGVPQTVVIDNLKAAVIKADWYDPELHPKLRDFADHYNVVILPNKPYHPHHKGKVERGVGYVKSNALKGRTFGSLVEENTFLRDREERVADQRIHGTTRKQVGVHFEQSERPALGTLAPTIFPCYQEASRKVQRDCFVEVAKAYYEAPPELLGRTVWVRWDARTVRLYNHRVEEVMVHARTHPGGFSHRSGTGKTNNQRVQQNKAWLLKEAQHIGCWAGEWAASLLVHKGVEALRPLLGLRAMTKKYTSKEIDEACECALKYGAFRLRDLRALIDKGCGKPEQGNFDFMDQHPLIRDLSEYQSIFTSPAEQSTDPDSTPSPQKERA